MAVFWMESVMQVMLSELWGKQTPTINFVLGIAFKYTKKKHDYLMEKM